MAQSKTKHREQAWVTVILTIGVLLWVVLGFKAAAIYLAGEILFVNVLRLIRGKRLFNK